jgi:hypothetical protein
VRSARPLIVYTPLPCYSHAPVRCATGKAPVPQITREGSIPLHNKFFLPSDFRIETRKYYKTIKTRQKIIANWIRKVIFCRALSRKDESFIGGPRAASKTVYS